MNPYLENPELWAEVHSRLIVAIADGISPQLRPKYRVAVEKRVYQMTDENSVVEPIPAFLLPLRRGDTEPVLDLQTLIHEVYDAYGGLRQRAGFDLAIDYTREPVPPLGESDTIWAKELLQQQGLLS